MLFVAPVLESAVGTYNQRARTTKMLDSRTGVMLAMSALAMFYVVWFIVAILIADYPDAWRRLSQCAWSTLCCECGELEGGRNNKDGGGGMVVRIDAASVSRSLQQPSVKDGWFQYWMRRCGLFVSVMQAVYALQFDDVPMAFIVWLGRTTQGGICIAGALWIHATTVRADDM